MADPPATMSALRMTGVGPLNKLRVSSGHMVPKAGTNAALAAEWRPVLVKVEYAALNPVDHVRPTKGFRIRKEMLPLTLGFDFAGTVAEVAPGAKWSVGDRVWGFAGVAGTGSFAEYCSVPGDMLAAVPEGVSSAAASTLGCTGLTACAGVWHHLGLSRDFSEDHKGTTIVVWGASSSVGQYAAQLAKLAGYRVVGIASRKHFEYLGSQLGVEQLFDYHDAAFIDELAADSKNKGLKHVFDCIGPPVTPDCYKILASCGTTSGGVVCSVHVREWQGEGVKGKPDSEFKAITELRTANDLSNRICAGWIEALGKYVAQGKLVLNSVREFEGLETVPEALQMLQDQKFSAEKAVVKVA